MIRKALFTLVLVLAFGCGETDSDPILVSDNNSVGVEVDGGTRGADAGSKDASTADDAAATEDDAGSAPSNATTGPDAGSEPDMPAEIDAGPMAVCGDGQRDDGERCDDGNRRNGDGCNSSCRIEQAYQCTGQPSRCSPAPSPGTGDGMCESTYDSGVYDPFPGNNGAYPRGSSDTYSWRGENFESYAHDELVERSSSKGRRSHLDVTSGELYTKHINGSQLWKRGWTTTYNFRVLSRATSGGDPVRLTDVDVAARVYLRDWQSGAGNTSGAHLFARYQTENDLYVASLRNDGKVTIKKKHCDRYTTLAQAAFSQGPVATRTWYDLRFQVVGQFLRFYVDGNLELEVIDDTLSWGTTGIRTDRADVYFDDWKHR